MFWNYLVQSAFDSIWSIKGAWWLFKSLCITLFAAVCFFVSIFFFDILLVWAIVLMSIVGLDFVFFWVRFGLTFLDSSFVEKRKKSIANTLGALLILKLFLRLLGAAALVVNCILLIELAATPISLCIVLLVASCLIACTVCSREFFYTFYKYIKYRARKDIEEFIQIAQEENNKIGEETYFENSEK